MDEFSNDESGKISFIIDGDGNVVAHPEEKYYQELYNYKAMTRTVTKTDSKGAVVYDGDGNIVTEEIAIDITDEYKSIMEKALAGETGQGYVCDNGKEYYVSYTPIEMGGQSDSWAVITLRDHDKAMSLKSQIFNSGIIVTIVAIIFAIVIISVVVRSLTKNMKKSLDMMVNLSNGELSADDSVINGHDEAAELLRVTNDTVLSLKGIIIDINESLGRLAEGDVSCHEKRSYPGEFDTIGKALNSIERSLNHSFENIGVHSREVTNSANAISAAAQALSRDAVSQASAVEQLASSVKDTSGNVQTNAEATRKASQKMEKVSSMISESNEAAKELKKAMAGISDNAKRINGISKLIQDISFQTNLLSMNASVEASRAGEDGKGFSVIASEIRELAAKCAEASKETGELLETTQASIESGMVILNEAVVVMQTTVDESGEVNEILGCIAQATAEQSEAVEQISKALAQISNVVQNNSAASEETATTGIELKENAGKLQELD